MANRTTPHGLGPRKPGRPVNELIPPDKIRAIREAHLANALPQLSTVAEVLGVSRSMIGKILANSAHFSGEYEKQLASLAVKRVKFIDELTAS